MDITLFLAKLIGFYMLIIGFSILLKQNKMIQMAEQFANNLYFRYFGGMLILIIGLLIVASHNFWSTPEKVIISLIGWGATVKGAAFMLLPDNTLTTWMKFFTSKSWAIVGGMIAIVVGIYLLYIWYAAVA